jgi:hypothetical protein
VVVPPVGVAWLALMTKIGLSAGTFRVVLCITIIASAVSLHIFKPGNDRKNANANANAPNNIDPDALNNIAESIRNNINDRRTRQCQDLQPYLSNATIQFFQIEGDTAQLEILLDDDSYYSKVRFIPSSITRFKVISTVPEPCDQDIRDKLAVSSQGMLSEFLRINHPFL